MTLRFTLVKTTPTTVVRIQRERRIGSQSSYETAYFTSSGHLLAAEALAAIRLHWSIENSLHWSLDVAFQADHKLGQGWVASQTALGGLEQ